MALTFSLIGCNKQSADPAPSTGAPATALAETPIPDASAPVSYEAELEFIDLVFKLQTHGDGARRLMTVIASRSGAPVGETARAVLDGRITTAFAADFNGDQQAEIAVITQRENGAGFTALAFNGSTYTEYRLPKLETSQRFEAAGPEEVAFDNGQIVRRFPIKAGGSLILRYQFDPATGFVATNQ